MRHHDLMAWQLPKFTNNAISREMATPNFYSNKELYWVLEQGEYAHDGIFTSYSTETSVRARAFGTQTGTHIKGTLEFLSLSGSGTLDWSVDIIVGASPTYYALDGGTLNPATAGTVEIDVDLYEALGAEVFLTSLGQEVFFEITASEASHSGKIGFRQERPLRLIVR